MLKRITTILTMLLLIVAAQGLSVAAEAETNSELVYVTSTPDDERYRIELVNLGSDDVDILLEGQGNQVPSSLTWSPDGSKLAYTAFPDEELTTQDIFVFDMQTRDLIQVTSHPANDGGISWLNNERIVFTSNRANDSSLVDDIYSVNADGSDLQLLLEDDRDYGYIAPIVHPNGEQITFQRKVGEPPTGMVLQDTRPSELMIADLNTLDAPEQYLEAFDGSVGWLSFASNSNYLAFQGTASDAIWQVYVTPVGQIAPQQVSQNNARRIGARPAWHPDGERLAFIENGDDETITRIVSTDIDGNERTVLAELAGVRPDSTLAWSPDGEYILYRITGFTGDTTAEELPQPSTHLVNPETGEDITLDLDPLAREFAWRPNQ